MLEITIKFIIGITPIITLALLLKYLGKKTVLACFISLVLTLILALSFFSFKDNPVLALAEGTIMAIWPIVIVIVSAVFVYNLTVDTGNIEVIKSMLSNVSNDSRILMIIIAWCFGAFLEAVAGFGVAVAIPSSMLCALGFNPVKSIALCLLANGLPTMFGSIGIPTVTLASITSLNSQTLSFIQTLQSFLFIVIMPFVMIYIYTKDKKSIKELFSFSLVAGFSLAIPQLVASYFLPTELVMIIAGTICLITTLSFVKKLKTKDLCYQINIKKTTYSLKDNLISWSSFILIFIFLLITSKIVPSVYNALRFFEINIPLYLGNNYTINLVNTPGVLILIAGIIGGLIQKAKLSFIINTYFKTILQLRKTIFTMIILLSLSKVMIHAGMIEAIALFFVSTLGIFFPLVSPLLGAIGTYITGSATNSQVLFGNLQLNAANSINTSEYWLVASNSLGTAVGKMLSPQTIAIGIASCGVDIKASSITKLIIKTVLYFFILMSIMVFVVSLFSH